MNIAVYCGSRMGRNEGYRLLAERLGRWIAENHHTLVYGGSNIGLMGVLADAVLAGGGEAIGVMPRFFVDMGRAHAGLTRLIVTQDMSSRKKTMAQMSEACIALPGGPGTLEEITEIVSWTCIGQSSNPCVFLSEDGYYAPLVALYDQMVREGFMLPENRAKMLFTGDLDEAGRFIAAHRGAA